MSIIYLIGLPGSGKSTLARALCEAGEVDFVDLDSFVEIRERSTVPAIIRLRGEAAFRSLESIALEEVAGMPPGERPLAVATGGGTPCFADNMDFMLRTGLVVWLRASESRTLQRLEAAPGQRPAVDRAIARGELGRWLGELSEARAPHYSRAHITFDTSELDTPAGIAAAVSRFAATVLRRDESRAQL